MKDDLILKRPSQQDLLNVHPANTPKLVLLALVDLNECYHGKYERVIQAMHEAMDMENKDEG